MSLESFTAQALQFGFSETELDAWCTKINRPTPPQMSAAQRQRMIVWLSESANRARVRRDLESP